MIREVINIENNNEKLDLNKLNLKKRYRKKYTFRNTNNFIHKIDKSRSISFTNKKAKKNKK